MNIFAKIKQVAQYEKVKYYSVLFENEEYTEFEKFILNHQQNKKIQDEFNDLLLWITYTLGTRFGALKKYFRHEGAADALPPQAKFLEIDYEENLRLYCCRISDHVVILFNGGIKTKGIIRTQDCEIVKPHFDIANKLACGINEAFISGDICLSLDQRELLFEENFEIEI